MTENEHKRMKKFENVYWKMKNLKMSIITKHTLGYITMQNLFSLALI